MPVSERPDDQGETFAQLLSRVREGDERAIAELVVSYEPEIRRTSRALLGPLLRPTLDSMDIAQSIQVALLRGMREEKFDVTSPQELVGLVTTMVRRKVADHWRTRKRRYDLVCQAVQDGTLQFVRLAESAQSKGQDPAQAAELKDLVDHILDRLEPQEQQLLELRMRGHSTVEAAKKLGVDADVLRVKLGRLRRKLRERGLQSEWL